MKLIIGYLGKGSGLHKGMTKEESKLKEVILNFIVGQNKNFIVGQNNMLYKAVSLENTYHFRLVEVFSGEQEPHHGSKTHTLQMKGPSFNLRYLLGKISILKSREITCQQKYV